MLDKPDVKELLKYIYIQKTSSFKDKDQKLLEVNDKSNIFKTFYYTPTDIYSNEKYYL